jgi:hypothetical protein
MKIIKTIICRRGAVLIISMIFVLIFSALAVSMATMSGTNLQLADNQRKADGARACAESGVDILRFWMGRIYMPGTTQPDDRFSCVANFLQTDLAENGISNIPVAVDANLISIGIGGNPVVLYSWPAQHFSAEIQTTSNIDILQMDVTGSARGVDQTIRVNYNFGTRAHTVFDYGVATKGALNVHGNIEMSGANVELDAGVYIESEDPNALEIIGNSSIAGDVHITDPDASINLQGGQATIGGETAPEAYDHVFKGVPPTEFPVPEPDYFRHYVQNTYDPNNVLAEYDNLIIPSGTNPITFGNVTFRGIVFIEAPNIVAFTGNTTITGIIVGNGDLSDNSGTNRIDFLGTVVSYPVTDLPNEPQFEQLHDETGTFLMAPGFSVSFGGNFDTLNGAIAANGIEFFGDAGGIIDGSVINYSGNPMTLSGNSDLFFNRSGTDQMPAGFGPEIILFYVPDSYSEVIL